MCLGKQTISSSVELYLESCQTSQIETFSNIVHGVQLNLRSLTGF